MPNKAPLFFLRLPSIHLDHYIYSTYLTPPHPLLRTGTSQLFPPYSFPTLVLPLAQWVGPESQRTLSLLSDCGSPRAERANRLFHTRRTLRVVEMVFLVKAVYPSL